MDTRRGSRPSRQLGRGTRQPSRAQSGGTSRRTDRKSVVGRSTPPRSGTRRDLTGGGKRRIPPISALPVLLALGSSALLIASIVLMVTATDSLSTLRLSYVLGLAGFAAAAVADTVHKRKCDREMRNDRFTAATMLWFGSLVVTVISAYLAAGEAAL